MRYLKIFCLIIAVLITASSSLYADYVDELIAKLNSDNDSIRVAAVAEPSSYKDRRSVKALIEALRDENQDVKIAAISSLGRLGDRKAVEPLMALLGTEGGIVREEIKKALIKIGKPAEPYLIEATQSDDYRLRIDAFTILVEIDIKKAVDIAYRLIAVGGETEIDETIKAIGRLKREEFIPFFVKSLEDPRDEIRKGSEAGLIQLGEAAFQPALKLLKSENTELKGHGINILGGIRDARGIKYLEEIVQKDEGIFRPAAVRSLGNIGSPEAQGFILSLIEDEDIEVRRYAIEALGKVSNEEIAPTLIDIFRVKEPMLQWTAVSALRYLGKSSSPYLLTALNDKEKDVREYSALALGEIRDERALESLYKLLNNPQEDIEVRTAALKSMAVISDDKIFSGLIEVFGYNEPQLTKSATDILIRIGEPAVVHFINLLSSEYENVRENAVRGLVTLGKKSLDPLLDALYSSRPPVSLYIIEILGQIGDSRAVEPLIERLKGINPKERLVTVEALGKLSDERSVESLKQVLKTDDTNLRLKAISALGRIGSKEATLPLVEMLGYPNSDIRKAVIFALGDIRDNRAIEPLKGVFKDTNPDIRRAAVQSLGRIGGRDAVSAIAHAVEDEARNVRFSAVEVLKYNTGLLTNEAIEPLSVALMTSDVQIGSQIAYILGSMGKKSVPILLELLKDNKATTRMLAADALGWTNDQSAVPALIDALKDGEASVRVAATYSLGFLKDGRAVEPIAKQIMDRDKTIRIASATALGNIGDGKAAMSLQIALNDEDASVRSAAEKALAKLTGQSCPLVTGLSRFNITGFLWFLLLGLILVLPFVGSKVKSASRWLDRISPNTVFPQIVKWWIMLVLGIGALALFVYCYLCKTELGAPIFALQKPRFLDVLWLYSFRVFPFFIGGCILSGWIIRYFSGNRRFPSSLLGATFLGAVTPLCSCAVIPMAMGMLRAKMPVRAVIAFLVATPILSPFIIVISYGIMGAGYTLVRIVSVFLLAMAMGILIEKIVGRESEGTLKDMPDLCKGCAMARAGHSPSNSFLLIGWNQVTYLLKYMVMGLLLGALLEAYLPATVVINYMSSGFLGLIASATVGIPIYLCSGQEVLVLKPLMDMGLPMGHAIAFTIGANGICLTSIALLAGAIGRKTTIAITVLFWVFAILFGYLINIAFLLI